MVAGAAPPGPATRSTGAPRRGHEGPGRDPSPDPVWFDSAPQCVPIAPGNPPAGYSERPVTPSAGLCRLPDPPTPPFEPLVVGGGEDRLGTADLLASTLLIAERGRGTWTAETRSYVRCGPCRPRSEGFELRFEGKSQTLGADGHMVLIFSPRHRVGCCRARRSARPSRSVGGAVVGGAAGRLVEGLPRPGVGESHSGAPSEWLTRTSRHRPQCAVDRVRRRSVW